MAVKRAPEGLGAAGRRFWRDVVAGYELDPGELVILLECCRTADRMESIEAELSISPLTVEGSTGQPKAHPLLAEQRAQARLLEALVRSLALPMPGELAGRRQSPQQREAAQQRWRNQRHG